MTSSNSQTCRIVLRQYVGFEQSQTMRGMKWITKMVMEMVMEMVLVLTVVLMKTPEGDGEDLRK